MKKNIFRSKILAFALAVVMVMTSSATAFAADATASNDVPIETNASDYGIMPLDGVENWYAGRKNTLSAFTFTNTNTTPTKTVMGTKVRIRGSYIKAPGDAGIGEVVLSIRIKDASGNFITNTMPFPQSVFKNETDFDTGFIDLGYYGREIHVWFDASSAFSSNGHYRSIKFVELWAEVQ